MNGIQEVSGSIPLISTKVSKQPGYTGLLIHACKQTTEVRCRLSPLPSLYNDFAKPLVDLPVPISDIIAVAAVLVTHMHYFDRFDAQAAEVLPKEMSVFVQPEKEKRIAVFGMYGWMRQPCPRHPQRLKNIYSGSRA